ncbi:hypothetical protein HYFRA_00009064 [Hymenoscyphus fraxineus]|uniref:IPT/TIG domain-containing protein n=1 Tax=Hymenoscyphus fraxineus TaxID=746836 RepID=A0A9N9KTI6_9HELO|nr:hypothetical protein HYFRA_00009064 [Hymenoscyphus fraxineus]
MQNSGEVPYSASSPPFILDSEMVGPLDSDPVFEFFDSNQSIEGANSPGIFLGDNTDSSHFNYSTPVPFEFKSPVPSKSSLETGARHQLPSPSTASPTGSLPDSSSDSSGYKRKSSSESSREPITPGDVMMADGGDWRMDMMGNMVAGDGTAGFGTFDGTINPASMSSGCDFNDKVMDNDFDFESAASSPSPFGNGQTNSSSPSMPMVQQNKLQKISSAPRPRVDRTHLKANSQNSVTHTMNGLHTSGSREASPLSAMTTSQESSPSFHNNLPSPPAAMEYTHGMMFQNNTPNSTWPANYAPFAYNGLPTMQPNMQQSIQPGMQSSLQPCIPPAIQPGNHPGMHPGMNSQQQQMPRMVQQQGYSMSRPLQTRMTIHPTPLKSRVETQIPIKITLYPVPPGITKIHLPTHTIAKPKLLSKPTPERSPDMLELYTTLVCTSAMMNPENKRRAFERAAQTPPPIKEEAKSAKSDNGEAAEEEEEELKEEDKPLNGGDVKICPGCIVRERKRAARKKVKKIEEEELWHKDEAKRVVVFNCCEVKDWETPSPQARSEATGDRGEPWIPEGALQVDAPMRIACYCRHQNEKLGFQVIITIKDWKDRVIAQEITTSIMITDDHKTHIMPTLTTQTSTGSDGQLYSMAGPFPNDGTLSAGPVGGGNFRLTHSTTDLQSMAGNFNMQYPQATNMNVASHPSQTTSATMTPRNGSRQTSPITSTGPLSKKRKASGSMQGKVPSGLEMTRLETGHSPGQIQTGLNISTPSTAVSPFTPHLSSFPMSDVPFGQSASNVSSMPQQYNTGPPTPNSNDHMFLGNNNRSISMENLVMAGHPLFSAPVSAHPSRAPSPNSLRNGPSSYPHQPPQTGQASANGIYGMPLNINHQRPPTIHKLIPGEGPRAGGIEVTCLGSGFCQGLEVMFGDAKATTTTFWGETSLVCLLPPSAFPGIVPVTFKFQHQQQQMQSYAANMPKSTASFKYVDDDEQQLIRTALAVLGHKMTGKMEDIRDLARRIVGDGNPSWGGSSASPSGGSGGQQMSGFNAATFGVDVEATLLRCLDLIDLDDSPHMPRLNLRRTSGQTMLHLACSLGLNRVVAALLARGANAEARDKGGYTPMHFAALHGHPQIVRRLMLSGADPTLRSLQGFTPSDMATSEEVLRVTRRVENHTRRRSGSSMKSRSNSATSLRSVWEPLTRPESSDDSAVSDDSDGDNEYEDEDADAANEGAFWMRSIRRMGGQNAKSEDSDEKPILELPDHPGLASPSAAMTAFRDHVSAQIQQIQRTMQGNLRNLPQMQMPALPDYQNYLGANAPMVRRISNLVHRQDGANVANAGAGANVPKEHDYKWWDLFSGTVPAAPPAYEDIFPGDADTKRESATRAAADAAADNKCTELFDQAESSTAAQKRPMVLETVRIGKEHIVTREQQDRLRLAHAEKVKRLSRDRNLFFIWIPLLTVVILAMLYNRLPQVWIHVAKFVELVRIPNNNNQARIVEV